MATQLCILLVWSHPRVLKTRQSNESFCECGTQGRANMNAASVQAATMDILAKKHFKVTVLSQIESSGMGVFIYLFILGALLF